MSDKARIIELQRQVRIARVALERIKAGDSHSESRAAQALDDMLPLDRKYPLQSLVGHGRNTP